MLGHEIVLIRVWDPTAGISGLTHILASVLHQNYQEREYQQKFYAKIILVVAFRYKLWHVVIRVVRPEFEEYYEEGKICE